MYSIDKLKEYLENKDVKPSYPRLKVLEYLLRYQNHPTADQIYNALVNEIPTLSKTTVYNTLHRFVESKVATPVCVDGGETHYDATVNEHGHFKCQICKKIFDFDIDLEKACEKGLTGFKILNRSINYKGFCPNCVE